MNILRAIGTELLGLFVDDWAFALLVLAWIGLFRLLGPHRLSAPLLFAGLAALTLAFVVRKANALRR